MADQAFMYAIVVGAFAVLTGILFAFRAKRKSEERKAAAPLLFRLGERKGAIQKKLLIFFRKANLDLMFFPLKLLTS
jgi:hypothetical protein